MTTLLVQLPSGSAHFHQISEDQVVLGRSRSAGIQVAARGVSRRHCQISVVNATCILEDLDSKNGVYLNDERVRRSVLKNNDCIVIGEARVYFYTDASSGVPESGGSDRSRDPVLDSQFRWVDSHSEILHRGSGSGGLKVYDPKSGDAKRVGKRAPGFPPGDGQQSTRDRLMELRIRSLEHMGYVVSLSQLFERAAEVLTSELALHRVIVLRGSRKDAIEPVYLSTSLPPDSAESELPGEKVLFSRDAFNRVRREMRPLAFHLGGPDELAELKPGGPESKDGVAPFSMLAPLVSQGHWFGAIQIDCPPSAETPDDWTEDVLGEVADVISHGIGCLHGATGGLDDGELIESIDSLSGRSGEFSAPAMATMTLRDVHPTRSCVLAVRLGLAKAGWPEDEMSERLLALRDGSSLCHSAIIDSGGNAEGRLGNTLIASFAAGESAGADLKAAAESAINIQLAFVEWNRERRTAARSTLEVSIVISSGPVLRDGPPHPDNETLGIVGAPVEEVLRVIGQAQNAQILLSAPAAEILGEAGSSAGIEAWTTGDTAAKEMTDAYKEFCWKGRSSLGLK